eukprot:3319268-Pleurochrysis_carterae.AAC.1
MHALHATLVHRGVFDEITWAHLPPDHSHDAIDRCFSTEVYFLLVNFAFNSWFDGFVNSDSVSRIGVPLVWRYLWDSAKKRVLIQYKMSLADKASFEQDEWGPWEDVTVDHLNEESRFVFTAKVNGSPEALLPAGSAAVPNPTSVWDIFIPAFYFLRVKRSTSGGVEMMRAYPDLRNYPGVEDWLPADKWSTSKVFYELHRWEYVSTTDAEKFRGHWEALRMWHTAYSTADSIAPGMMHNVHVPDSLQIGNRPAVS